MASVRQMDYRQHQLFYLRLTSYMHMYAANRLRTCSLIVKGIHMEPYYYPKVDKIKPGCLLRHFSRAYAPVVGQFHRYPNSEGRELSDVFFRLRLRPPG